MAEEIVRELDHLEAQFGADRLEEAFLGRYPKGTRGRRRLQDEWLLNSMAEMLVRREATSERAAARKLAAAQNRRQGQLANSEDALFRRLVRKFRSRRQELLMSARRRQQDHIINRYIAFLSAASERGSDFGLSGPVRAFVSMLMKEGYGVLEVAAAYQFASSSMAEATSTPKGMSGLSGRSSQGPGSLPHDLLDDLASPKVGLTAFSDETLDKLRTVTSGFASVRGPNTPD
ncbi:hypothetical protein [Emcibacter sp. SYSU 3D8]|uniref:hypothetical protein n=1 Tax=Emcibacter sp. SYSU 3D8 TaxID=3133969 RepID=UPI0031FEC1EB